MTSKYLYVVVMGLSFILSVPAHFIQHTLVSRSESFVQLNDITLQHWDSDTNYYESLRRT